MLCTQVQRGLDKLQDHTMTNEALRQGHSYDLFALAKFAHDAECFQVSVQRGGARMHACHGRSGSCRAHAWHPQTAIRQHLTHLHSVLHAVQVICKSNVLPVLVGLLAADSPPICQAAAAKVVSGLAAAPVAPPEREAAAQQLANTGVPA